MCNVNKFSAVIFIIILSGFVPGGFFACGAMGGGGMGGGGMGGGGMGGGTTIVDPPAGAAFQDPPVMPDINALPNVVEVNLDVNTASINVNGTTATLLTYNKSYPGPTIYTKRGDTLKVHFKNSLRPTTATNLLGFEKNHTNVHTHGWHVSPMEPSDAAHIDIPAQGSYDYVYDLSLQEPGTLCLYHPHKHGLVAEQYWSGLFGVTVTADETNVLAPYETHIMILKDIKLSGTNPTTHSMMMDFMNGKESNLAMVNGLVNPVLTIRPGQVQRWRFANGSNAHFYKLTLERHSLNLIGTDGGLLDKAYPQNEILLSPGERADVLVQGKFTPDLNGDGVVDKKDIYELCCRWLDVNSPCDIAPEVNGDNIINFRDFAAILQNMGKTCTGSYKLIAKSYSRGMMGGGGMGGGGMGGSEGSSSQITMMTMRYGGQAVKQSIPAVIEPNAHRIVMDTSMLTQRSFTLSMMMGRGYINGMDFDVSPYTIMSNIGMFEVWEIINQSGMDHPWHQHVNEAQVLSITGGDPNYATMLLNTPAKKDVVIVPKMGSIKLLVPVMDFTGMTMYHCHILEHEDIGMMGMWHLMDDGDMNGMTDMNSMSMGMGGGCMGGGGMGGSNGNTAVLTEKQAQDLIYLREEEKLARDVYLAMYGLYGSEIFNKISMSEQCHTNRVKSLIDTYKLQDPVADDSIGVFTNPVFRSLFVSLTSKGAISLKDALEVGVAVEEMDINDIEVKMLPFVTEADVKQVLSNLLMGSYRHLSAFNSQLAGQ